MCVCPQEELRDQERIIMLKEQERMKEEELAAAVEKKMAAAALMQEVAASNAEQIRRKEQLKVSRGGSKASMLQRTVALQPCILGMLELCL